MCPQNYWLVQYLIVYNRWLWVCWVCVLWTFSFIYLYSGIFSLCMYNFFLSLCLTNAVVSIFFIFYIFFFFVFFLSLFLFCFVFLDCTSLILWCNNCIVFLFVSIVGIYFWVVSFFEVFRNMVLYVVSVLLFEFSLDPQNHQVLGLVSLTVDAWVVSLKM